MKLKLLGTLVMGLSLYSSVVAADTEMGSWLIRLRAIDVIPDASSSRINLIGGHVTDISDQIVPELDFSYFFTPNIAAELILGTSRHNVKATHTALGKVDLGKVSALPPTLTAQYHFFVEEKISPYVGAGVNFTHFFDIKNGPVATSTSYTNSFGPALQVGADFALNEHWSINIDVKKLFMQSKVHVNTALGQLHTDVKLNPIVVGLGIGYRL